MSSQSSVEERRGTDIQFSEKRGHMLEHPSILHAARYEVRTISRKVPSGNPQRLDATRPGEARKSEVWMMIKSDPCGDTGEWKCPLSKKRTLEKL